MIFRWKEYVLMFLTGNQTLTLTSEWQFCVHFFFFLHLIFYFPYLRGQQFVHFLLKSLSFLTCFFFFNIVNLLIPFKNIFTYLPPTTFSYFVYAKFIFLPICVFYFCKWLVKGHWSWINQTSKSAFWRRDWSNYGHCRGTTGIGSWNY